MEKIVSLCKRRSFIFPGSEIYGGLANTWDYGPYGSALKKNVKDIWWKTFVEDRDDMVGLDAAILMNPKTWEASGHIASFSDPLIDCKECKMRHRADKLISTFFLEDVARIKKKAKKEGLSFQQAADSMAGAKEPIGVNFAELTKLLKGYYHQKTGEVKEFDGMDLQSMFKIINGLKIPCPDCGKSNFTEPKNFNLMFKTKQGVVEGEQNDIYLRPETAQGIFVNFKNIIDTCRVKIPFGIGQIGKAFRNEITPGNFTFRTREFEQMEIEYFCHPDQKKTFYDDWKKESKAFFVETLGIRQKNLRFREHDAKELSHYSSMTFDVEYRFPFGKTDEVETWGELQGLADRGDYDLKQHQAFSGKDLSYRDPQTNEKFLPHVIEPSFGCDRTVLTVLIDAYAEETLEDESRRTVMRFKPSLAPVQVAVFPLLKNKEELVGKAREVHKMLKPHFRSEWDESGNVGKRYRRQDEIGTPYCITVDFDTLEDDSVTVRDRDTMAQERIKIEELEAYLREKLS